MEGSDVRGARLLLVDADTEGRAAARRQLELLPGVEWVREAADPAEALLGARDADLAIVEVDLPGSGGLDTVRLLRRGYAHLPVLVIAERNDPDVARAALALGALSFVLRDAPPGQLAEAVTAGLHGGGIVDRDVVGPIIERYGELLDDARARDHAVIASLAAAVEAKDIVTSRHLTAVSETAIALAELVDPELADDDDFLFGCLLHDVGKIGIPEQILSKPGPLDPGEWAEMRRHPHVGARVIRPLGLSATTTDIVLHHHERWDGHGYPSGLSGDDIPLAARVFAVCDALDAMTADRPYREALPPRVAFERVRLEAGSQFDPHVVAALERGIATGTISIGEGDFAPEERPPTGRITGRGRGD
jgi:putative two-component system response regulator